MLTTPQLYSYNPCLSICDLTSVVGDIPQLNLKNASVMATTVCVVCDVCQRSPLDQVHAKDCAIVRVINSLLQNKQQTY